MIKKVSKKQSKENRLLTKVYKEIADTRGHYCTGCGRWDVPLSHSHIIPRSRRKDLVCEPRNITYHCLGGGDNNRKGCHDLWGDGGPGGRQLLLDYHINMEYILEVVTEYYFLLTEL